MRSVLTGLAFILLAFCGSSCVRYHTTTSEKRDTVYTVKRDTVKVIMKDSTAVARIDRQIDSVFIAIATDCPNIKPNKINTYRGLIKDDCTLKSLTGGAMVAKSVNTGQDVIISFKGNEAYAYMEDSEMIITRTITTETIADKPYFRKILDTWHFWLIPWLITIFLFIRLFLFK